MVDERKKQLEYGGLKGMAGPSNSKVYPRRPYLIPPDYHIEPKDLFEGYIEQKIRFAGIIPSISAHIDVTNRTDVLRVIDGGKRDGHIPYRIGYEHDALLSLCVSNIKILKWGEAQEVLLRIPMHETAATCYIKDDGVHILSIKYGTPEVCKLAVLYCDSKKRAEEICALTDHCFQLVYAETLTQLIDSIDDYESSGGSNTKSAGSYPLTPTQNGYYGTRSYSGSLASESVSIKAALLKDYIRKLLLQAYKHFIGFHPLKHRTVTKSTILTVKTLNSKLNMDELKQFAQLYDQQFKTRTPTINPASGYSFSEFCDKLYLLYGSDRKSLMAGMYPFIPEIYAQEFEDFLKKYDISLPDDDRGTFSSLRSRRTFQRTASDSSSNIPNGSEFNGDVFDRYVDMISHQIENLGNSVDSHYPHS